MKKIPLTKGMFALVDDEDFEYLNQWKWFALRQRNNTYYAVRNEKAKELFGQFALLNFPLLSHGII